MKFIDMTGYRTSGGGIAGIPLNSPPRYWRFTSC